MRKVPVSIVVLVVVVVGCTMLVGVESASKGAKQYQERGVLWRGRELRGEQLTLDSRHGASYHLAGLRPGALYEARISYAATNPVKFKIWFVDDPTQDDEDEEKAEEERRVSRGSARTLLNVVQRRFSTKPVHEENKVTVRLPEVEAGENLIMFVSAERDGVPAPGTADVGYVKYNIVVEELALADMGGVPLSGWTVALGVLCSIGFAAFAANKLRHILLQRPDTKTA